MSELHPEVRRFKDFVKKHPNLIKEVRQNKKNWQDVFEEWYILGEEDESWNIYKTENESKETTNDEAESKESGSNSDFMTKLTAILKNVDMNDMQQHISGVKNAITNIQELVNHFQSLKQPEQDQQVSQPQQPFQFRKD